MDHKEIQAIWDAFQSIQEKKLSDKQKELDMDNDGDIEGDDLAALRNNKKKLKRGVSEKSDCPKCNGKGCDHCDGKGVHEEAPADPVKKAPARKGDKSNSDSSNLKGVQEAYLRMKEDPEQVDEISGDAKAKYINKALDDYGRQNTSRRNEQDPKKKAEFHRKERNRTQGISRAYGRSGKAESVEHIEEGPLSNAALDRKGQTAKPRKATKTDKASKYLAKKQKDKNAEINKNDPNMADRYGRSVVDLDKAVRKAGKKGLDKSKVRKGLSWKHGNSAQDSKLPEGVELRWAQSLAEMLSDISEKKDEHTKGATESEKYDSKFSKGAKDFVAMHQKSDKEIEDKEQKGHDDVSKAGRATKASAGRGAADQLKNGDKSVVKPVSGVVTKETK
jgi:hypothetical protein